MADFDPDAYLAATQPTPAFDPDAYLKQTAPVAAPVIPRSGAQSEDLEARDFLKTSPDQVRGTGDQPIVPIPRIPQQQGILAQLGAGAVNAASGVVEMAETPQLIASLPIAPARLTQAIFGGQALSDIKNAYEEAAQPDTTIQKGLELGGRALTDAIFGVGMVHGAVGDFGAPKLTESIFGKEAPKAEPEAPPQAVKDEPQAPPARPEAPAVEPAAEQPTTAPESKGFVEAFSTAKGAVSDSFVDSMWDKVQKNEPIQRIAPLENSLREAQKAGTLTSREDIAKIVKGEPQEQVASPTPDTGPKPAVPVSTEGEATVALGNTKEITPTAETQNPQSEIAPQGQATPPEKPPVQTETTGIAERYREEEQPGSVIPGAGVTAEQARLHGQEFINNGGDPYMAVRRAQAGNTSWRDVGVARAEYERLGNDKRAAEDALEQDPNNPQLQEAFNKADDLQRKWSKDAQPILTRAGDALRAATRSYPREINSFSDFTDIVNEHYKGDIELTPKDRADLQKAVRGIKDANHGATIARNQVTEAATKKAGGRFMSFDDLKADLKTTVEKLLEDCPV